MFWNSGFYKCCNDDADTETEARHEKYIAMKKQCQQELRGNNNRKKCFALESVFCYW